MSTAATDSNTKTTSIIANSSSYLKSYPYLFVRETDQTDYFCTLCDSYLKEDDLQAHLFQGHRAENLDDFFVRVSDPTAHSIFKNTSLYICVVCWAKISSASETVTHRKSCKVDPSESDLENGSVPMNMTASKSSSKIENGATAENDISWDNFVRKASSGSRNKSKMTQQLAQCQLCPMVVPSQGQLIHMRDYHRISSGIEQITCPLCLAPSTLIDLSMHISTDHGVASPAAVNGILFWVLSSMNNNNLEKSSPSSKTGSKSQKLTPSLNDLTSAGGSKLNSLLTNSGGKVFSSSNSKDAASLFSNGSSQIPNMLQSLLSKGPVPDGIPPVNPNLNFVEAIVSKFTRRHYLPPDGKESIQCLVCSKWFAVPPVKHLRGHMMTFTEEKRRLVPLIGGNQVCLICYDVFDNIHSANSHLFNRHDIIPEDLPGHSNDDAAAMANGNAHGSDLNDIPTVILNQQPINNQSQSRHQITNKVELDNAGRVKSGKVRKQCELCGEWSNIKWFFKHMSEVHQALFCRCCREYLPIHEHEEHKRWHAEPPYMGQKIRIENGQPVVIDRKERASLTPIGSLASWGGSSGGKVVKAVDTGPTPSKKKRKAQDVNLSMVPNKSPYMSSPNQSGMSGQLIGHLDYGSPESTKDAPVKDTLMPKETCPVCGIPITYKNLARHIKLKHKIKYKFCHKCRKLVPSPEFEEHKSTCNDIVIDGASGEQQQVLMDLPSGDDTMDPSGMDSRDESIDPTEFLDASSPMAVDSDDQDSNGSLVIDTRKSDEFRANTSKNKLESLVGKEFKHPRRRCAICGYSVSYSNFKRHLRNAHPAQYQEYEQKTPGDFKTAIQTLSHEIHDEESGEDSGHLGDGLDDDTLGSDEKEGSDDEMDNHSERNYGDKNDGINEAQEEEEKSDKSAKIGEEEENGNGDDKPEVPAIPKENGHGKPSATTVAN